jgi:predicted RNA methylase
VVCARRANSGPYAVECTRDRLAGLIGRDVAVAAHAASGAPPLVIDLFAGSANTLYWIRRQVGACRAVGFELDDAVFELARANLSVLSRGIDLVHDSYERGLRALGEPDEDLIIVFVAPPWGRALSEGSGLGSLAEVTARLSWSAMKVYDINAPGQNHGLLLAGYGVPGGHDS